MATCFCGHGKKIGLSLRGPNKQGRRTVELLDGLQAAQEGLGQFDSLHVLDSLIDEGVGYKVEWEDIVHGGLPVDEANLPRFVAEARAKSAGRKPDRAFKKAWEAWGKRGMTLIAALRNHAKPQSGRKGLMHTHVLVEELKARLDSLGPGEARQAGEEINAQLEPIARGEVPMDAKPGFLNDMMLRADLWLAATER